MSVLKLNYELIEATVDDRVVRAQEGSVNINIPPSFSEEASRIVFRVRAL